jgi:hypothetical protein
VAAVSGFDYLTRHGQALPVTASAAKLPRRAGVVMVGGVREDALRHRDRTVAGHHAHA